nr:hypothetical protein CFP56_55261 [Quercus suber]
MDKYFTLYVHHGGYFNENPEYVGGDVGVVDDCDLNKWSKVEIEAICKDFGYTFVSRLWYKMPRDNEEEHPVHEPILINGGNGVTLDLIVEPENVKTLDVSEPDGGSDDKKEFYGDDDDWDSHQNLYEGGVDAGRDGGGDEELYDGGGD